MNWLKKGPDLKPSDLRIPNFVHDLYYDLKERHLLPLVALLLVAIVAAPIYFKNKSDLEAEPVATVPPAAEPTSGQAALTVARSQPGLRDPRRRLKHAHALNPFAARGGATASAESSASQGESSAAEATVPAASTPSTAVPAEATLVGGESSSAPAGEPTAPVETYVPHVPSGGDTSAGGNEAGSAGKPRTRYASEAIDVRVVSVPSSSADSSAKRAKPKAQVRRDLPELTMLPARATPAVTFMGVSKDGKKALMLVSSDVESIFGEAKCIVGSQSCQLLALEPEMPETFVYGPRERTYRIELLKIRQTVGAKPRRAALGATKRKHGADAGDEGTEAGPAAGASEPAERGGE